MSEINKEAETEQEETEISFAIQENITARMVEEFGDE